MENNEFAPKLTLEPVTEAPAAPQLTLDPNSDTQAAEAQKKRDENAVVLEKSQLTPAEQKMVTEFAQKIDITAVSYTHLCQPVSLLGDDAGVDFQMCHAHSGAGADR